MHNYSTVEEKSREWNISPRHVQNLCKSGQIEGAVKKAGIWFLPKDAVSPAKRPPSGKGSFEFSGTKKRIFEVSMDLFMEQGFENVSLRTIASVIGIKSSAIYNHFESKQAILDTIYDFCCHYYTLNRPSLEDVEPVLESGSLTDIIASVWYAFDEEYKVQLTNAIKIVLYRAGIDNRAKEIAKTLFMEDGAMFVSAVFDRAVDIGRLAPFDTKAMSVLINSIRIYTLQNWLIDDSAGYMADVLTNEQNIYAHALKLLTDLKPPSESGFPAEN